MDKYITIASPLHYARFVSPSRAGFVLGAAWLFAVVLVSSIVFIPGFTYATRSSVCVLNSFSSSGIAGEIHAILTTCLGFVLPICIVAFTNGRILIIASHHRHRIVSALWDVTLSAQATVTHQKSHFYLTNYKGRSAATTIFYHVGSLLIMYLPSIVCRIYEAVTGLKVSVYVSTMAFILLAVSPAVNGFVYGVRNKILRKLLVHVLRKQIYRSEVSCEIQARTPSASCSRRPSITPSIALPLQKQLTRRMSEIFTPTNTTPSGSSQMSDARYRLERQSSDISSTRGRSSESSSTKDSTPSSFRTPETSPLTKFFPKGIHFQRSFDLSPPNGDASTPPPFFTGTQNSLHSIFSFNRQSSLEIMSNGSGYNGGHRQSLRRALFARNKQKSLDLDMVHVKKEAQNLSSCPPRSASHHEMQEQPRSPSSVRPLVLQGSPLTAGRRSKKVSWSSDSFSNSQDSQSHSEVDVNKKRKRKNISKENEGGKTNSKQTKEKRDSDFKENNNIKNNKCVPSEKFIKTSSQESTSDENGSFTPKINLFDNPLSKAIPPSKLPKLYSPSDASIIAKIHICH